MRARSLPPGILLLAAGLLCFFTTRAAALEGGLNWSGELGGSFKLIGALFQNYDEPLLFGEHNGSDSLGQALFRLTYEGGTPSRSAFEAHLVQSFTWSTLSGGAVLAGNPQTGSALRYRIVDGAWSWLEEGEWEGRAVFDRLNFRYSLPQADITFGRQAVNFSQAYFWSPLDVFLPFDPQTFDREYKPGVDALRLDLSLGDFSSLSLAAVPGRELVISQMSAGQTVKALNFSEEPWYGSALMSRLRTNIRNWDLTLQGGKVYGAWQVGAGFSGEAGEFGVHGEGVWVTPSAERTFLLADASSPGGFREEKVIEEHASAVAGMNHRFENSLYLGLEYFYNGAGGDYRTATVQSAIGEALSLGRHLAGAELSYEIHPLITGHLSWLYSLSDASSLLTPVLSASLSDESELVVGTIFGFGDRPSSPEGEGQESLTFESEFGTYANLYYGEFKIYF